MSFIQSWRWFGPNDPISLQEIKQTGTQEIVTALHHIPNGAIWTIDEILKRQELVSNSGMRWSVVESLPVHEDIKKGHGREYITNYQKSIENLGKCGLTRICYNFMPVLDWSRTDLDFRHPDGTTGLRFDMIALAAFDIFILKRPNATDTYDDVIVKEADALFKKMSKPEKASLINNILAGLPGAEEHFTLEEFKRAISGYQNLGRPELKANLFKFLKEILPVAEKAGIMMCIHPDDPPLSLFGLPRIVSTEKDIDEIYAAYPSINNGLTFCTGSLGALEGNNLPGIVKKFAERIHFLHLRNIKREEYNSFHESGHLIGDADMYKVIKQIIREQLRRAQAGRNDVDLPFRPDHGLMMLDDSQRKSNPGYSLIGRLCGLAEIRGLEAGIRKSLTD